MTVSEDFFARAGRVLPGGEHSSQWCVAGMGCEPVFMESGLSSRLISVDAREYIDYVMGFGTLLFGHAHPRIVAAITGAVGKGCALGAPCPQGIEVAERICQLIPSVDMVRMVNSGTEAAASALRLARACTNRDKIIKFAGGYHGFSDAFMVESCMTGPSNRAVPGSLGVPHEATSNTLLAQYNDVSNVETILMRNHEEIAAIIVEPVASGMGVVPPAEGFLKALRRLCDTYSILLIFDETVTGFRLSPGGAQTYYGVRPDLTILGKALGAGLPFGAYGGKVELMRELSPLGKVYQGDFMSGNPVSMAAALAVLKLIEQADYEALDQYTGRLTAGLEAVLREAGYPITINRVGSMFTLFFTDQPVRDLASVEKADSLRYAKFYKLMRQSDFHFPPSNRTCATTSFSHRQEDLERTLEAAAGLVL